MYYNIIYSQLFNFIPRYRFEKIVKKSGGDRYCKHFTAWEQFLTLLFAQISGKDSLLEIENALLANHKRLYHLGMEAVAKSTLSEASQKFTNKDGKSNSFQMDQTESENQKFSWHKRKRCNVANLGGDDPLSADCLSQISAWFQVGYDGADKSYSRYLNAKSVSIGSPIA